MQFTYHYFLLYLTFIVIAVIVHFFQTAIYAIVGRGRRCFHSYWRLEVILLL